MTTLYGNFAVTINAVAGSPGMVAGTATEGAPAWLQGALNYVKNNPYSVAISAIGAISEIGWRQEQRQWMDEVDKKLDLILSRLDRILGELAEIKTMISALPGTIDKLMQTLEFSRVRAARVTFHQVVVTDNPEDLSEGQKASLRLLLDDVAQQANVIAANWHWTSWPVFQIGFCVQAQLCLLLGKTDRYYYRRLLVVIDQFIAWLDQGFTTEEPFAPARLLADQESIIASIRHMTYGLPAVVRFGFQHYVGVPGRMPDFSAPVGAPGSVYKVAYTDVAGDLETGFGARGNWEATGWQDRYDQPGMELVNLMGCVKVPGGGDTWKNAIYSRRDELFAALAQCTRRYVAARDESTRLQNSLAAMAMVREGLRLFRVTVEAELGGVARDLGNPAG